MGMPVISIVVANYNYGRFLNAALESITNQQGFDKCELIVVDGESKDESVEIIKKYACRIVWWCSEPDKGQSDAFNKGFSHAKGKLGCWLNADDIMLPGTLAAVLKRLDCHPGTEWISGGTAFFNDDMRIWKMRIGTGITRRMHGWVDPTVIGGPSAFFSLEQMKAVGGFDVSLRYTMDSDLWNRFFDRGMKLIHLNRYFWGFRLHDQSKTAHSFNGGKTEEFRKEDDLGFVRKLTPSLTYEQRVKRLRLYKIFNGSLLRSVIDTRHYSGKNICELYARGDI